MMKFIWFCAAGYSFLYGIVLLALAILLSMISKNIWQKLSVYAAAIVAVFLVFMSATPLQWWLYIVWIILAAGWLLSFALEIKSKGYFRLLAVLTFCFTLIVLAAELPFFLKPVMPKEKFKKLYVIGDSVSAGIGGREEQNWPKLLLVKYGINVVNLSVSGSTVTSAIRQANQIETENSMVFLEIGGNDFLSSTPYPKFEENFRQILEIVKKRKSTVVMLEMPMLPWYIEYGRIQRQVAKDYNVIIIPKRFFVSVVSINGTTPDLVHLSAKGHQLMMEKMWFLLGSSLASEK